MQLICALISAYAKSRFSHDVAYIFCQQTAISPQRQAEEEKPAISTRKVDESRLSPMDEIFLRNTNSYQPKMTSHYKEMEDNDEKFDETWPSSERPSSMK